MTENREYKSDVFSMLMEDKANALEVYNALNNSDYTNPDEVEIVRLEKGMNLEEAVDDSIEDCISNHILKEFFEKRKDEVKKVTHLDYTWEKREKLIRQEEYKEGKADSILELLEDLGEIPEEIQIKITTEKDLQILNKWLKAAAKADSMKEFLEKIS